MTDRDTPVVLQRLVERNPARRVVRPKDEFARVGFAACAEQRPTPHCKVSLSKRDRLLSGHRLNRRPRVRAIRKLDEEQRERSHSRCHAAIGRACESRRFAIRSPLARSVVAVLPASGELYARRSLLSAPAAARGIHASKNYGGCCSKRDEGGERWWG